MHYIQKSKPAAFSSSQATDIEELDVEFATSLLLLEDHAMCYKDFEKSYLGKSQIRCLLSVKLNLVLVHSHTENCAILVTMMVVYRLLCFVIGQRSKNH